MFYQLSSPNRAQVSSRGLNCYKALCSMF